MSDTSNYIAQYSQDMVDACAGTGLFPSVMMAQGILESGNGKSGLAAKYNNQFGIKCECTVCPCYVSGMFVSMTSTEYDKNNNPYSQVSKFKTYRTPFDSFVDRVAFLKKYPRYTNAGVFTATTPQEQTQALQDAGYATSQTYAAELNKLISDWNLEQLDSMKPNSMRFTTQTWVLAAISGVALSLSLFLYFKYMKK